MNSLHQLFNNKLTKATGYISSAALALLISGCSQNTNSILEDNNSNPNTGEVEPDTNTNQASDSSAYKTGTSECGGNSAQITIKDKEVTDTCGDKSGVDFLSGKYETPVKKSPNRVQTYYNKKFKTSSTTFTVKQKNTFDNNTQVKVQKSIKVIGGVSESSEIPDTTPTTGIREALAREKNKQTPYAVSQSFLIGLRGQKVTQTRTDYGILQNEFQISGGAVAANKNDLGVRAYSNSLLSALSFSQAKRLSDGTTVWRWSIGGQITTNEQDLDGSEGGAGGKIIFNYEK